MLKKKIGNRQKKISIITINYNNKSGLKKTIKSVLNQSYKNYEYIIVDGYSNDGSNKILKIFEKKITKIIFRKKLGVYDAINQGLKKASGKIIALLHSGDIYRNNNTLKFVIKHFEKDKIDCLIGSTSIIKNKKQNRFYYVNNFNKSYFKFGFSPPHPSTFITYDLQKKIGYYDTNFKISSDFNFFIKLFFLKNIKIKYVKKIFVTMNHGGISNQGIFSLIKITKEINLILKKNKIKSNLFFSSLRIFFKVYQFFNAKNFR